MRASRRKVSPSDPSINGVLGLLLEPASSAPAVHAQRRLDALFRELAKPEPSRSPDAIEDLIWSLWISHPQSDAEDTMAAAVEAMSAGALDLARPMLDRLIAQHPDWAEAWNKRATLAYLERRDADALGDITEVLRREPRHFGAIAGFGQICLRHGRVREARAAFQIALRINPHIEGLGEVIQDLAALPRTLH